MSARLESPLLSAPSGATRLRCSDHYLLHRPLSHHVFRVNFVVMLGEGLPCVLASELPSDWDAFPVPLGDQGEDFAFELLHGGDAPARPCPGSSSGGPR